MAKSRKYTIDQFIEAVKTSFTITEVLTKLNLRPVGGNYKTFRCTITALGLDISHFGKSTYSFKQPANKISLEEILAGNHPTYNSHALRLRLIEAGIFEHRCVSCNNTEWLGHPIPLELEHKNGNHQDHRLENLCLLCPTCHVFTPTYKGKNIKRKDPIAMPATYESRRLPLYMPQYQRPRLEDAAKVVLTNKEILQNLINTKTYREIAKEFNISENTIKRYCQRTGVERPNRLLKRPSKITVSREELECMLNEKSCKEIAQQFGVTDTWIRKRCKQLGIQRS